MVGAHRKIAVISLPGAIAIFCAFKPVSNGIANQMNQRIGDLLDDAVVEFRFGASQA